MKRKDATKEYKWDLSYLYTSQKKWSDDLNEVKKISNKISMLKGKLKNKEKFFQYLKWDKEFELKMTKLSQYLHYGDLDTTDINFQKLNGIFNNEISAIQPTVAFVSNEIKDIGEKKIMEWLNSDEKLHQYIYPYKSFFRDIKYLLNNNDEELLSKVSQSRSNIYSLYDMLAFADKKPIFLNYKNKKTELTNSIYSEIMEYSDPLKDQELRIQASNELNYNLIENKHTFAKIYESILQYNFENVKLRKYDSCLQKSLNNDNVDPKMYLNLIKFGKKYSSQFIRYCNIIKRHFKFKKFYATDRSLKLVKEFNKKYTINDAKKIIREALKPLGKEYLELLEIAWSKNFIDYYEDTNKVSGAYSTGGNGVNPIILMNWDDRINSVNTLAHEIGHSIHTLFSDKYQPFALSNYPIILAEVASTVNEHLLFDYLYKNVMNKNEKIYLIQNRILEIMNTFYRQIHFADFELQAHNMVEKEIPLTSENLVELFEKISDDFGYVVFDKMENKPYSWPRVSHFFHSPFYVYKYATCILASFKLFNDVKNNKKINLINFLKSGGKKDPLDILKDVGINYNDDKLYLSLVNELEKMLDELENLLK